MPVPQSLLNIFSRLLRGPADRAIRPFVPARLASLEDNRIPKTLIQTYKDEQVHPAIHRNITKILANNPEYAYRLITDSAGLALIREHFTEDVLSAYTKLNIGAAKGDFLRYIAMYIHGGVYLDLDSSIEIALNTFIPPDTEFVFFMDKDRNIQQWCFMSAPGNELILRIIDEMVLRINAGESNIFKATGPTLVTDVFYNDMNNTDVYDTASNLTDLARETCFKRNRRYKNGLILDELQDEFEKKFRFRMKGFKAKMLYRNGHMRYEVTFNAPTPDLYKIA